MCVSSSFIENTKLIVSDISNCLTKMCRKRKINQSKSKIVTWTVDSYSINSAGHSHCMPALDIWAELMLMYPSCFSSFHCILLFCFDFFDRRLCCTFWLLRIYSIFSMEGISTVARIWTYFFFYSCTLRAECLLCCPSERKLLPSKI